MNALIDAQLVKQGLSLKEAEIWVTVVGQLRLKDHYYVGKMDDGTLRGGGYGHLGMYPGQLVVKTMADPDVRPKRQEKK